LNQKITNDTPSGYREVAEKLEVCVR